MIDLVVVAAAAICAFMAIRAPRLLFSALWLAGCSALVALELYGLGAAQVAVIELSVGAGLVTVLFVFAIAIAGEDAIQARPLVPRPLAAIVVLASVALLAWFNLPVLGLKVPGAILPTGTESFANVLWKERGLDVLVQVALIFAGVLGALGLLGDTSELVPAPTDQGAEAQVPAGVRP